MRNSEVYIWMVAVAVAVFALSFLVFAKTQRKTLMVKSTQGTFVGYTLTTYNNGVIKFFTGGRIVVIAPPYELVDITPPEEQP